MTIASATIDKGQRLHRTFDAEGFLSPSCNKTSGSLRSQAT